MSLEDALKENTLAIRELIAALWSVPVGAKPEGDKPKATRTKKTEPAEAQPAVRHFFHEKNDAVYRIAPEDPVQTPMTGSVEITADEFAAHQTRLAAKYAHLTQPAADPAPAIDNNVTADPQPEVKPADLMSRVVILSQKADGRSRMEKILAEFGVPKFSLLPGQHLAKALDLVNKAIDE